MRTIRHFAALYASLCLTLLAGCSHSSAHVLAPNSAAVSGEMLSLTGIPNAGKISDVLFRGAQPRSEGFKQSKKLGIAVIVDLRAEDSGKRHWEQRLAGEQGIQFVGIPVREWNAPTDRQVAQFLALFQSETPQKVFVHCHYGADRTGVFVAAYRIAFDHWSADQAMKEMRSFGFHEFWHPAMETYVRGFSARLQADPMLTPFHKVSATAVQEKP